VFFFKEQLFVVIISIFLSADNLQCFKQRITSTDNFQQLNSAIHHQQTTFSTHSNLINGQHTQALKLWKSTCSPLLIMRKWQRMCE